MPSALKSIPQPPRTPVVGHAFAIDSHAPVASLNAFAKQLGPIFQIDVMGNQIVFVAGAKLASELWDETRFDKAVRGALALVRAIGGDGLFTAKTNEPNWAKAHNILLAPFGGRAMQSYHGAMLDIADQLAKKWERLNPDEEINVVHDMTALTLDTIGLCGFDYRFNSFYRRDYHPFVGALVRSLETMMLHRGLPLEKLKLRTRLNTMKSDLAFMNKLVDDLVRERRGAPGSQTKKDLLNAMLSGVDKQTGTQLDDLNIRYQINTFLIAGHETTSGLLSYTIYALLKNPDVLAKARAEVDRVFGNDEAPTYAQVTQLHYINQVLKESLRLWPPAPAIGLYALKDESIGGYPIPKGRTVNVLIGPLQRDTEVWGPRADIFDPENFAPEAEAKRPAWAFKPFGNGQRACIGRGFALHEAALALGVILQRFDLIDVDRYQLKLKETLTVKPDGFKIKVTRRAEADRPRKAPVATAAEVRETPASPATRPTHNTPLLALYGSNLGTAEEYAHRLAETAEINGFATTLGALDDHVGPPPKPGGLVIFCASYNGAPPDNASKYVTWLRDEAAPDAFAGVKYVVFGCGNSDWTATYQSVPRYIDERIAALGGERIAARGEGNAREDLDGQYEAWFAGLRAAAARAFSLQAGLDRETRAEPLYRMETLTPHVDNAAVAATGGRRLRVLENRELLAAGERSTRHIEIELGEGQTYRAGDHLAVAPRNDDGLVAAVAARFGLTPETTIKLEATPGRRPLLPVGVAVSVAKLLTDYVELQQTATRKQIETLAEHTRCPVTKPKLLGLAGGDETYRAEVYAKRLSVFDLLLRHPACEAPFPVYLEMLPSLQPRYYSISSAPLEDKQRVSITVGVVRGAARSGLGEYRGVASNYLERRQPGDFVHAAVRETKAGFRMPEDPATPLIMIGPGTGLAPFRGFLRERAALRRQGRALGPAMLFFGCRRPDEDFLYAGELQGYAADDLVDLHVAFSRPPGGERTYVQDLMRREADKLWLLIEAGAIIYVCGDGSAMEPDVKRALIEIHAAKTGGDSQAWIVRLGETNRYVLDVWSNA
jgi:cytochrome P450/NADPH-cytochrome P450 reductase